MKKSFLFFALLFVALTTKAQETNKTLVKTLDPKGTSIIDLKFKNKGIKAEPWDKGTIRIQLEIIANFPEAVVSQLIKAGRYTLTSSVEDGRLVISANNLNKAVSVGGKDLEDDIRVYTQTPGYYAVEDGAIRKNIDAATVAGVLNRAETKKEAEQIIKEMSVIKEKVDVAYTFVYKTDNKDKASTRAADEKMSEEPSLIGKSTNKANKGANLPNLQQTQKLYGEILISGQPIEYDDED